MKEFVERWQLTSGVGVNYISQPDPQLSSALIRVNVGSMHEPDNWPGLAHLAEHMLFAGGERFQRQQRLLPWIHQQGGQVNATTGLATTCFYFQCHPERLIAAVLRLLDMLLQARLDPELLSREVQIIDAEYQLRRHDNATLIDALVRSQIVRPRAMNRFSMGNATEFGHDLQRLNDALHVFYNSGYAPENMQLWLSCARPFAELKQLFQLSNEPLLQIVAKLETETIVEVEKSPGIKLEQRSGYVGLDDKKSIILTYSIRYNQPNLCSYWGLLKFIIEDNAPQSLFWQLAESDRTSTLSTTLVSHSPTHLLFNIIFQATSLTDDSVKALSRTLKIWFKRVLALTEKELIHYQQQYQQRQRQLPLMEQLRNHALKITLCETSLNIKSWRCLITQLIQTEPQGYYLLDPNRQPYVRTVFAGFTIPFLPVDFADLGHLLIDPKPVFYPQPCPNLTLNAGNFAAPVFSEHRETEDVQILLRPAPGTWLTADKRQTFISICSPLFSLLGHYGGQGEWLDKQGTDIICLSAPNQQVMAGVLALLVAEWPTFSGCSTVDDSDKHILIKSLLTRLPTLINQIHSQLWTASIAGMAGEGRKQIRKQLGSIPVQWVTGNSAIFSPEKGVSEHEWQGSGENALVAFIPFTGRRGSIQAARILSRYYEPAFYQWLREELAIGYAVSCRYQNLCDLQGILFLVQSSKVSCFDLKQYCQLFLHKMTVELASVTLNTALPEQKLREGLQAHVDKLQKRCLRNRFSNASELPLEQQVSVLHEELCLQLKSGAGYWLSSGEK